MVSGLVSDVEDLFLHVHVPPHVHGQPLCRDFTQFIHVLIDTMWMSCHCHIPHSHTKHKRNCTALFCSSWMKVYHNAPVPVIVGPFSTIPKIELLAWFNDLICQTSSKSCSILWWIPIPDEWKVESEIKWLIQSPICSTIWDTEEQNLHNWYPAWACSNRFFQITNEFSVSNRAGYTLETQLICLIEEQTLQNWYPAWACINRSFQVTNEFSVSNRAGYTLTSSGHLCQASWLTPIENGSSDERRPTFGGLCASKQRS
jgi:hypothetical protein